MIKYYIKFSIRNIIRQKLFSFINIIGFSIGIFIVMIIGMYVLNEYNYDRYSKNYKSIYRFELGQSVIPPGVATVLKAQIPEVLEACRTTNIGRASISYFPAGDSINKKSVIIQRRQFVDPSCFNVLGITMIAGDPANALTQPNSCVMTEKSAKKIFGEKNPIGESVLVENRNYFKVTGIVKEPTHSHFQYEVLFSISSISNAGLADLDSFDYNNYMTYVLLNNDHNHEKVRAKIYKLLLSYNHQNLIEKGDPVTDITLRPLKDIYFFKEDPRAASFLGTKHGNKPIVDVFITIAIFILVIAIINFINLTTAKASIRVREIAIKKVVGSSKYKLILQFLTESILVCFLAIAMALTLLQILAPVFNNSIISTFNLSSFFQLKGILILLAFSIVIGILAGIYPAFYLTQIKTLSILKDKINYGSTSGFLRKALIVFQFIITSTLISGTIIIVFQIKHLKNKDLGFNKDNIVNIFLNRELRKSSEEFKEQLLQNPNIKEVSYSHGIPGNTNNTRTFQWKDEPVRMRITSADPAFFDLYDIQLIEGRFFSNELNTDKLNTCLINETAAKIIGWEQAVGQNVNFDSDRFIVSGNFEVIGVFKDYHIESLHKPIVPLAIFWNDNTHVQASIKISNRNIHVTLEYIKSTWNEFLPEFPFDYSFLDQSFDNMYKAEERIQKLFIYFSILAVIIACLGLFGLSAFMAERKTKEIGIRKILGSSTTQVISKLSKEIIRLVIIANIIAIPLSWIALNRWLYNYPYRVNIFWWVFLVTAITTFIIAFLTVSYHSYKAAISNPVDAIRHE